MPKDNKQELEELTIPKGTIVKINGIPFELPEDTKVLGLESNLRLALEWKPECYLPKDCL